MNKLVLVFACSLTALTASAREYAPRVVSPHNADTYSMKTFRQYHRWKDLSDDALAWEVYKYLVDTRTGLFHMNQVLEGNEVLSEYRTIRDPVKIINVYGYAYCGILGPVMAGIWQDMEQGPARTLSLPAWNHVLAEVYYDDAWHYLDVDVRAAFRRPDGTLASMAEAQKDDSLWTGRGPLFFPNDALDRTRDIYRRTPVHHYHGFNQSGHTMDFVLRQGETLTRWWQPQGERWHHADVYHESEWLRRLIEQPPRGPKPNHRHFTVHNYANGRFVYRPNLTDKSTDFADGVYDAKNVRAGSNGLTLVEPGDGYAIFEIRSPYIIVPQVGQMDSKKDDWTASVAKIDGDQFIAAISQDNGKTWIDVMDPTGRPAELDLSPFASGTYGYLLKLKLRGKPGGAVIRNLGVTTWVQVAPAALPSLRAGRNQMEYRTGDHYGLKTRVMEVSSNASQPENLRKHVIGMSPHYDPSNKTLRIRGPLVVQVDAPPHTKIAWFLASGSFRTHLHAQAAKTKNTISYSADQPNEYREIYRANVPTNTEHWHYNASREIRLKQPAERLYVRYVGDPGLNNFRIYAHCLDDGRTSKQPVRITHVWRDNDDRKTKTIELSGPAKYEITTGDDPMDESIEMAVPSHVR